ncbi:hypothetical protein ALC57_00876 [Trachymyrmex cornetzi]|uniref:Uncharacterized protein n=1 Tax=Trachymyrmex cornetzi TaxID=471704 RepID=A0A195ENZ5_9HYME|nr:hypothetical protein ALC57_00876 [Trachymyrmex cornetzi]
MNKRETVEIVSSRQCGAVIRRKKLRISWLFPTLRARTHTRHSRTWKEIQWRTCRDMVLVPDTNVKRGRRAHDTTGDKRGDSRYGRLHEARKYNRDVPLERESFVSTSGSGKEKSIFDGRISLRCAAAA